jgi:amidase
MTGFAEYDKFDALGLAQLVQDGEVSAEQLLDEALARVAVHNPDLNAVIHLFADKAREACQQLPSGLFTGVPFLLKDLLAAYAGEPLGRGSRAGLWVPGKDAELVSRYKACGLNIFGKTNLPEFGLTITTESKAHGPAHNPWKSGYSTGGSSGGSAATVAARIVPMAQADDGGGSIRFPAACCGVYGMKPSRGRTPLGPYELEGWEGAVVPHAVTLSVRDSAALLDQTAGPEAGAPYGLPAPVSSFLQACQRPPGKLRVAVCDIPLVDADVHKEAITGLDNTIELLQSLGHTVERVTLPFDPQNFWLSFMTVVCSYTAVSEKLVKEQLGSDAVAMLEPSTRNLAAIGRQLSGADHVIAKQAWLAAGQKMEEFHRQFDVLLTPTLIGPPVAHGEIPPSPLEELGMGISSKLPIGRMLLHSGLVRKLAAPTLGKMGFTILANMTGQPAMSVPLHWCANGLPLGMQFVAAYGNEFLLYQLAAQLEEAAPWRQRRPPILG